MVAKFAIGVVYTSGKFSAGVVDTGGNFAAGVLDTGGNCTYSTEVFISSFLSYTHKLSSYFVTDISI
jgi:hypothetical protein